MSKYSEDFSDRWSSGGRAPEKSTVAQTFNRLSHYLKEKGSLRDLGLEIAGKLEPKGVQESPQYFAATTRNLFPTMEDPGELSAKHQLMDLFPQQAGVGFPMTVGELGPTDQTTSSKLATMATDHEPKTAQMIIFYGGQVLVFENFPADKAGELMLFASCRESCPNSSGFLSTPAAESIKSTVNSIASAGSRTRNNLQRQPQVIGSDIPIARRASLHRFFDKRKDRVAAKAPYQVHGGPSTSSRKHEELFDLNL